MDTSKYANIKDLAIMILAENFTQVIYGVVPEEGHEEEAVCQTCGDLAAQYLADGRGTFNDIMFACKLVGEMISADWKTREDTDDVKVRINCAMDMEYNSEMEETFKACYNAVDKLIDERSCNGKMYYTCIEQIIGILDDVMMNMNLVHPRAGYKQMVYSHAKSSLQEYLKTETHKSEINEK